MTARIPPTRSDRLAGVAALGMAALYALGFVYFGVVWAYPTEAAPPDRMAYLAEHHIAVGLAYGAIYLAFGGLLSVLVVRLRDRAAQSPSILAGVATLFGAVWVGLVVASGMLLTTGLRHTVDLAETDVPRAVDTWDTVALLAEALGGGNELVGGLWALLISASLWRGRLFSKRLNGLGLTVGGIGVATVIPFETLTAAFGVVQLFWFVGVGCALLVPSAATRSAAPTCFPLSSPSS
ncbi:MAG: hypothetical protein Rubg2KO_21820 [Rubricoccaceae bacterium]